MEFVIDNHFVSKAADIADGSCGKANIAGAVFEEFSELGRNVP